MKRLGWLRLAAACVVLAGLTWYLRPHWWDRYRRRPAEFCESCELVGGHRAGCPAATS